jgi:hypothetical protein
MIEEKTVYVTRGKQFDTMEKAESHRVDLIGEFMDRAPILIGPRDRIKLTEYIAANRAALAQLLNY